MTAIRVAQVRATTLRAWDVDNYLPSPGVDVEFFLSHRNADAVDLGDVPRHTLTSVGDTIGRLPPYPQIAVGMVAGSAEHLRGLEKALDGFDIAHTVEVYFPISEQAVRARDAGACKAVVCTVMENIPFWPAPNRRVAERVRRVAAGVDHFIAITERAALHLETAGAASDRITVLPVGVDIERFTPRPTHSADDGVLRVVTVARLERGKGVEDLAIAAGLLSRRGIRVEVTYVGAGPSRAAIEDIGRHFSISDQLSFSGGIPWEHVGDLHADHDVFVLASAPTSNWREQFGYAVVEAMASGLPVLVGNSGSLMEVAGHADALITPHDPLSLADRLAELAADPDQRARMGAFSRERVLERFNVVDVRARLAELYGSVLERSA